MYKQGPKKNLSILIPGSGGTPSADPGTLWFDYASQGAFYFFFF